MVRCPGNLCKSPGWGSWVIWLKYVWQEHSHCKPCRWEWAKQWRGESYPKSEGPGPTTQWILIYIFMYLYIYTYIYVLYIYKIYLMFCPTHQSYYSSSQCTDEETEFQRDYINRKLNMESSSPHSLH